MTVERNLIMGAAGNSPYPAGTLFVTCSGAGANSLGKRTPAGVFTQNYATFPASEYAQTMVSDSQGNIYVSRIPVPSTGLQYISKTTPAGVTTNNFATLSFAAGYNGLDLLCDSSDNIYSINNNNTISKITPAGVVTQTWASLGAGGLTYRGAFDSSGNIYSPHTSGGNFISKVTPAAVVTSIWASVATVGQGIAVDTSDNVYVLAAGNIARVSPAGVVTNPWATIPGAIGGGSNSPIIDSSNNLYAINSSTGTDIIKITPAAVVNMTWATLPSNVNIGPYVGGDGFIYTVRTASRAVDKISSAGVVTSNFVVTSVGSNPYAVLAF